MVDNTWVTDIEKTIYSRLKAMLNAKLSVKYPNLNFTTVPLDMTNPKFPTIYIHEEQPTVLTDGLEQDYTSKVMTTITIEVFANDTNKTDSKLIAKEAMNIINSMGFKGIPFTEFNANYTRTLCRYRKEIHSDDVI